MLTKSFLRNCAALLLLIFVVLLSNEADAFQPDEDCLWISHSERIRRTNYVIPIRINFGRFPDGKRDLSSLTRFQVFYCVNDGSSNSEWILRTVDLSKRDRDGFIYINMREHDHLLIYAVAELQAGGYTTFYSAKSSLTRKVPLKPFEIHSKVSEPLKLDITPRFHYWRQVGEKMAISGKFHDNAQPLENLLVLDENLAPEMIPLGKDGKISYVPPDDRILNWQSYKASKETIVVAEIRGRKHRYLATYSMLLHRHRFMHHNHEAGLAVFGGTTALAVGLVLWRRKKSEF